MQTGEKPAIPLGRRQRRRPPKGPTVMTFRETRAFLADRAGSWKSEATEGHFAKEMRDYAYPVIPDVPVDRIGVEHIVDVLRPIWRDHHPTAVKLRSRIGQVLVWAEAKGWRSGENPARSEAVVTLLGNGVRHQVQHFRAIHYSQLPAFWQRLGEAASQYPDATDALRGDIGLSEIGRLPQTENSSQQTTSTARTLSALVRHSPKYH